MDDDFPEGNEQLQVIAHTLLDILATIDPETDPDGLLMAQLLPDAQRRLVEAGAIVSEVDDETGLQRVNPTPLVASVLHLLDVFLSLSADDTGEDRLALVHRAREYADALYPR